MTDRLRPHDVTLSHLAESEANLQSTGVVAIGKTAYEMFPGTNLEITDHVEDGLKQVPSVRIDSPTKYVEFQGEKGILRVSRRQTVEITAPITQEGDGTRASIRVSRMLNVVRKEDEAVMSGRSEEYTSPREYRIDDTPIPVIRWIIVMAVCSTLELTSEQHRAFGRIADQ